MTPNVYIGVNEHHGKTTLIGYAPSDRLRHMYMIGKTGVGKSTVFQNMCLQDIKNGQGICFVDPHGESIEIFYKLFDPKKTGVIGPQFEHWLRNAALTVMAGPEGGTLLEIPKLFVDRDYEKKKRASLTDPLVIDFWEKQMAKTSDFHKSEMLNYFMSKFGPFINNALMRNIIGQHVSS